MSFLQLLVSKTLALSPWQAVSTLYYFCLLRVSQLLLTAGTLGLAGWLACLAVSCLFVSVQPDDFRRV